MFRYMNTSIMLLSFENKHNKKNKIYIYIGSFGIFAKKGGYSFEKKLILVNCNVAKANSKES